MTRLGFLICLLLLSVPALAQDSGQGIITYLDENTTPASGFEFFECGRVNCARYIGFTFPLLFADATLPYTAITYSHGDGLVIDPPALPATTQTYTLAENLTWGDGTPITAYDVAYSMLVHYQSTDTSAAPLIGVRIEDERHLTLAFTETDCTTQARVNTVVIPANDFKPDFRDFAETFSTESEDIATPHQWYEAYRLWSGGQSWQTFPADANGQGTSGGFKVISNLRGVYLNNNDLIIRSEQTANGRSAVEDFLQGDANLLLDPPFARYADLKGTPGIQLFEAPGYSVDYLVFNQSDPNYPRDAFIDGEPLEQLPHPYFSDVRVRQAIQLAIDVPALIDATFFGEATPLNGAYSPASWAFDPDLAPQEYDPAAAESLLDAAGWREIDGSGYRQCFACLFARPGARLSINMHINADGERERVAEIMRSQLARIGVELYLSEAGNGASQNFDILFTGTNAHDPDLYHLFAREWDQIGVSSGNIGSADHPQLEAVLDQARQVPGCSRDERSALYHEAQMILREEVPAVWLYARHNLYAARNISGFAPQAGDPFWNINTWVVAR